MASSTATSRIKYAVTVAASSASRVPFSSSSKAAAHVSADPNPSHIFSKPWPFCKHAASLPPGEAVDPAENFHGTDPLSKIKESEIKLSKTRGAASPSPLKLICLGGPGVGKGSYASLVAMRLGIPHISTGDLVRKEVYKPPSGCRVGEMVLQQAVRTAMNQGKLVSDEIIFKLLSEQLQHMDPDVGFILDGFPRTVSQARVLDDAVGGVDMAINFHLEDDILVAKCLGRRTCTGCGQDYNLAHVDICTDEESADKGLTKRRRIFLPARLPPPDCASKLKIRGDDSNEAAVRERLRAYARESKPLEQHYRSQGKLVDLDVGSGAEYVWPRLMDSISELEHGIDYRDSYYH